MHIEFTKKEYAALFDLLRLMDHLLANTEFDRSNPKIKAYWQVIQKIYGEAEHFGYHNLVRYDPEQKFFLPVDDEKRDAPWSSILSAFIAENWWEQLSIVLSIRDTVREIGEERFEKLTLQEQYHLITEKAEQYQAKFAEHGVENIRVVGMGWGSPKR